MTNKPWWHTADPYLESNIRAGISQILLDHPNITREQALLIKNKRNIVNNKKMAKVTPVKRRNTQNTKPILLSSLCNLVDLREADGFLINANSGPSIALASIDVVEELGCSIFVLHSFVYSPKHRPKKVSEHVLVEQIVKDLSLIVKLASEAQKQNKETGVFTIMATTSNKQKLWEKAFAACSFFVRVKKYKNRNSGNMVSIWVSNN